MAVLRRVPASDPAFGPDTLARPGSVLLESQRRDPENRASYALSDPAEVVACHRPEQVEDSLRRAQGLLEGGLALAGFLSYEAGAALDPHGGLPAHPLGGFPLLWLGAYERASVCRQPLSLPPARQRPAPVRGLRFDLARAGWCRAVERAQAYIAAGDNYQTNLTCRLHFDSPEEPLAAYLRLRRAQPVPYGAYLDCGPFQVISQSPELFLRRRGLMLSSRPMKGTSPRGLTCAQDARSARGLRSSLKCRAENVMILDLMRNDLGRLAEFGSVETCDLFRVEPYATLLQMTSGVRCRLRPGLGLVDILRATFPPGSVTGAPKRRTMEIIHELEPSPRKLYTGAVGLFLPGGDLTLSVAIRTLLTQDGHYEMGIGSGIVADSAPAAEWEETRLKSRFFFAPAREFELLETLRWSAAEGFVLLEAHLRRLARSARYFGYPFSRRRALAALAAAESSGPGPWRVRLLLERPGRLRSTWEPLPPLPAGGPEVVLSARRTSAAEPLLYHKTTRRGLYEGELSRARRRGFTEVLFTNAEGYLTEGAFTNLMVRPRGGGRWLTPHLSCGLLPGLWRAAFMRRHGARQARLTPADLAGAEEVVIGNSVRGAVVVSCVRDAAGRAVFEHRGRRPGDGP